MEFGLDYVSNDRSFVRKKGANVQLAGVPKWPRVNPGTMLANERLRGLLAPEKAEQYSHLSRTALWELEDKHDVPVESIYGKGRLALNSRLDALYVLSWRQRGRGLDISRVEGGGRLEALLTPLLKTEIYDPPEAVAPGRRLANALATVPVFEVTGRADIPRLLQEIVQERHLQKTGTA
jgi:HprK-related kinase B